MYKLYIEENTTTDNFLKKVLNENNIYEYDIIKNKYGKKYLKTNELYFNISNKDNITVIAISDKEIGIDIESIKYNSSILNTICTESEEDNFINNSYQKENILNSFDKENDFTKMWTMKESYVKMLGMGLKYDLKKVDTIALKHKFIIKKYKNYIISISIFC